VAALIGNATKSVIDFIARLERPLEVWGPAIAHTWFDVTK
jgi:hypothetical protein